MLMINRAQCGGSGYTGATCCAAGNTCTTVNPYYYQCVPATSVCVPSFSALNPSNHAQTSATGSSATSSSSSKVVTSTSTGSSSTTSVPTTSAATLTGATIYTTTSTFVSNATHSQSAYPAATSGACGSWTLVDNVCCPSYCGSVNTSESCSITGLTAAQCDCTTPPSADCKSGTMYPEVHAVGPSEAWHYSVSAAQPREGTCSFFNAEINPFRLDTGRGLWFRPLWTLYKGQHDCELDRPDAGKHLHRFLHGLSYSLPRSGKHNSQRQLSCPEWRLLYSSKFTHLRHTTDFCANSPPSSGRLLLVIWTIISRVANVWRSSKPSPMEQITLLVRLAILRQLSLRFLTAVLAAQTGA